MTTIEETPTRLDPVRSLTLELDRQIDKIGQQASAAVDRVFQQLADAGHHYQHGPYGTESVSSAIAFRLEVSARRAIRDQLSAAILTYWVSLRRSAESEVGVEESIGGLFAGLVGVVAELIEDAIPRGELVGPLGQIEPEVGR